MPGFLGPSGVPGVPGTASQARLDALRAAHGAELDEPLPSVTAHESLGMEISGHFDALARSW